MERKPQAPAYADLPLPELLRQLSTETATLVRQEMQLARAELTEKGKKAGPAFGDFGAAVIAALGAFGAFTAFLIAVIALAVPLWASALIVTVLYGVVAAIAALQGKKTLQEVTPVPRETVQSVKEDVEAVRAGVQRAR